MADQDEDDQEIVPGNDPIAEAVNAGARFKVPESAAISRKRKLNVNSGKYRQRGPLNSKKTGTIPASCILKPPWTPTCRSMVASKYSLQVSYRAYF